MRRAITTIKLTKSEYKKLRVLTAILYLHNKIKKPALVEAVRWMIKDSYSHEKIVEKILGEDATVFDYFRRKGEIYGEY